MPSSSTVKTLKNLAEVKFLSGDIQGALQSAYLAKLCSSSNPLQANRSIAAYNVHKTALNTKINCEIDWYAVLGISDHSANIETIKKKYKKLSLMVHPDKNQSKAAEGAFKLVGEAWRILSTKLSSSADLNFRERRCGRKKQDCKSSDKPNGTRCNPEYKRKGCRFCGDTEYENEVCIECCTKIYAVQNENNSFNC